MAGDDSLERADVESVLVDGNADQPGARRLERAERPGEGRRLDGDDVPRPEDRPRDEVDRLAGSRGDHDLVGFAREPLTDAARGDLVAKRRQAFGIEVGQGVGPLVGEDVRRDPREVVDRQQPRVGPAGRERDQPGLARHAKAHRERVVRIRRPPFGQDCGLPVGRVAGRRPGQQAADEGPPADRRRHVAELGQPAIRPHGGQVVDGGPFGERPGRLESRLGRQSATVDLGADQVDELLGQ